MKKTARIVSSRRRSRRGLRAIARVAAVVALAAVPAAVLAGSLQPPGPPAPTMKPLSDVKPGTALHAADFPLVITQPGVYYLAEDALVGAGSPVLEIQADGVLLDLNGFTLASAGIADDVVLVSGPCDAVGVTVRTGQLRGGKSALVVAPPNPCRITVRDVVAAEQDDSGVLVQPAGETEISGLVVRGAPGGFGVRVSGPLSGGTATLTLRGSRLTGGVAGLEVERATADVAGNVMLPPNPCAHAVHLLTAPGGLVRDNSVRLPPNPCGVGLPAIQLTASPGSFVRGNAIRGPGALGSPDAHGIRVDAASDHAALAGNLVTAMPGDGIRLEGTGTVASANQANACAGHGFNVAGDDHLLTGNRATANTGAGAFFVNSSGHVYRENVLTGNAGGPTAGPGAPDVTDGGGNVL